MRGTQYHLNHDFVNAINIDFGIILLPNRTLSVIFQLEILTL